MHQEPGMLLRALFLGGLSGVEKVRFCLCVCVCVFFFVWGLWGVEIGSLDFVVFFLRL